MTDAGEKLLSSRVTNRYALDDRDFGEQINAQQEATISLIEEAVRAELERVLDIVKTDPAHAVERIERLMQ